MPLPDSGLSALSNIYIKVRRLTRSPSVNQLSDTEIKDYVNTFVLYDMPEHLKLTSLLSTVSFYTLPYIDTYAIQQLLVIRSITFLICIRLFRSLY